MISLSPELRVKCIRVRGVDKAKCENDITTPMPDELVVRPFLAKGAHRVKRIAEFFDGHDSDHDLVRIVAVNFVLRAVGHFFARRLRLLRLAHRACTLRSI